MKVKAEKIISIEMTEEEALTLRSVVRFIVDSGGCVSSDKEKFCRRLMESIEQACDFNGKQ